MFQRKYFRIIDWFCFLVGPLDVELIGRKDPVSVGRLYEFRCQSVGARPPPHITWWRGSIQLRENVTSKVSFRIQNQLCTLFNLGQYSPIFTKPISIEFLRVRRNPV